MSSAPEEETADPGGFDVVLVDGLNALGSRPDGWWRDRPAAMRRLVAELRELARRLGPATDVEVCFDGRPHELVAAAGGDEVAVGFAGPGRNAADRRIAARARELGPERTVLVVTSDKRLIAAARAAGAETVGSGGFVREQLRGESG